MVQRAQNDFVIYPELSPSHDPEHLRRPERARGRTKASTTWRSNLRTHFLRRKGADEAARKAAGLPYRPMEEWDYADGAVIKGDVRHFFQSIDHERLKRALAERFHGQERLQRLMWAYIDAGGGAGPGTPDQPHLCGLLRPQRSCTSSTRSCAWPLSGMYMDDWYVICPDMETAREALRLHPGTDFPGWGWS